MEPKFPKFEIYFEYAYGHYRHLMSSFKHLQALHSAFFSILNK